MRLHAFHRLYQYRQSISTKPFQARGCNVVRCRNCQVALEHCLCDFQPDVPTDIACMLIVSDNEVFKPSNTGRLIADVVQETYVYQWNRTEPDHNMLTLLQCDDYHPVIVFPADYVDQPERLLKQLDSNMLIRESSKHDNRKWLVIFIDGSWREARKIFRRSNYLQNLPVLSIDPDRLSQYQMRRSDNEQHLSTAEVAALVLSQAGETYASQCLQSWFETFRESYLLSKSRAKQNENKPFLAEYLRSFKSETSL